MTRSKKNGTLSLAERLELESPLHAAAADAAIEAVSLINEAMEASGTRQNKLAELLDITDGRVSQVVNGDGNVRVSTLARFLRAAGYRLQLAAYPVDETVPPMSDDEAISPEPPAKGRPTYMGYKSISSFTAEGVMTSGAIEFCDVNPAHRLSERWNWVVDLTLGKTVPVPPVAPEEPSMSAMRGAWVHV
ncbi:helix-turn-helix domain-containing protein [Sinomonas sp. ASV486]|uniref:helix-turn-helix domain-containing protein n=1 Tax=Sinomonas sp. ASV486 TaxID=3051170 RepID=UPI0027DCA133|nr:helix-turn-helix domain-containing protein [Sinomonas sp. ASV486]MDQ4491131.1 helix-turn-helix domain-containing protein [Sinomonas sp. ASV486]